LQTAKDTKLENHANVGRAKLLALLVVIVHAIALLIVIPELAPRLNISLNSSVYPDGYDLLASNIIAGNGYRFYTDTARTLMREPGYPMLLAGVFFVFGEKRAAVELANLVLALGTAWLTVRIAQRLLPNDSDRATLRLSYVAPVLWLFHPGTLVAESRGGVEILFACCLTASVWMLLQAIDSGKLLGFVYCGASLGVTVLVRSTPLLLPGALFLYLLLMEYRQTPVMRIAKNCAAMVVTMSLVLSPWIARNFLVTAKFIPTASVLGVSAQAGQYIGAHLFDGKPFWLLDREAARERDLMAEKLGLRFEDGSQGYYQTFYKSRDEVEFSKILFEQVLSGYKQDPMLFVRCIAQNILGFWVAGRTWSVTAATAVLQIPYLILAVIGSLVGLRSESRKLVGIVVLVILYTVAVHAPLLAQARYSVPLNPLVSVLASLGILSWRERGATTHLTVGHLRRLVVT
jgi:4-amino-4-deoxy-L-arabinose transferase-like glycosyltransferase